MNFVLKPTLERIALVEIAATLWKQYKVDVENYNFMDMDVFLSPLPREERVQMWTPVENKVMKTVQHLPVPDLLKEKILCFIRPIGYQILKWIEYHCSGRYLRLSLPTAFCWTSSGTIDRKRTAQVLIKDETLDVVTCFKLACTYCLEDEIRAIWHSMPRDLRKTFSYDSDYITYFNLPQEASQQDLVSFWINKMKGFHRLSYFSSSTVNSVECCVLGGNKVATEYFLKNLIRFGTDEPLITITKRAGDSEVVSFLLPQMNREQQLKVFQSQPYETLRFFLDWPLQSFFIETAENVWDCLSLEHFTDLLCIMLLKVEHGFKDWDYQNLFTKFWQKSPDTYKSYAAVASNGVLLRELLDIRDKENVKLILRAIPVTEKKNLLYSFTVIRCCDDLISKNEWCFLRFFLRECLLTDDEMTQFKQKYESFYSCNRDLLGRNKQNWDKLFGSSDESVCSVRHKRGPSEDESNSVKRFHSSQ